MHAKPIPGICRVIFYSKETKRLSMRIYNSRCMHNHDLVLIHLVQSSALWLLGIFPDILLAMQRLQRPTHALKVFHFALRLKQIVRTATVAIDGMFYVLTYFRFLTIDSHLDKKRSLFPSSRTEPVLLANRTRFDSIDFTAFVLHYNFFCLVRSYSLWLY